MGGGLSTDPHLAVRLNAFVHRHQVIPVLKGVAEIFRESEKLRENRERARLKFLFLKHGWTAESFQEELERRIGFHLDPAVEEKPPNDIYRDHVGIHPQKQAGYSYVGAAVLRGRISSQQMRAAADAADRFAAGELRTTNMQNLLIVNVPNDNVGSPGERIRSAQDCRSAVRRSGVAWWLAVARNSARSRLPRPRVFPAGWWKNLKSGCPASSST